MKRQGKTVFFSTHILADAESLCDRVAILNRGRLQGCGELQEILSLGVAATEIVFENPAAGLLEELAPYTRSAVRTGVRVRVEVPQEADVSKLLERALHHGTKVISLSPIKLSLEDYFLAQMEAGGAPAEEKSPSTPSKLTVDRP